MAQSKPPPELMRQGHLRMDGSRLGGSLGVAPRTHCEMKSFRLLLFPASLCNAGLGKSIRSAGPLARDVHVITHPGRVILIDRPGDVSPKETLAVAARRRPFCAKHSRRAFVGQFHFPDSAEDGIVQRVG
jgi:hypothetical protein